MTPDEIEQCMKESEKHRRVRSDAFAKYEAEIRRLESLIQSKSISKKEAEQIIYGIDLLRIAYMEIGSKPVTEYVLGRPYISPLRYSLRDIQSFRDLMDTDMSSIDIRRHERRYVAYKSFFFGIVSYVFEQKSIVGGYMPCGGNTYYDAYCDARSHVRRLDPKISSVF